MLWEDLRADQLEAARLATAGTCIVPLGVIEKHGGHLPLGTDLFIGRGVAIAAAAREPAVVFPPYYFGQIAEARHVPGTISIDHSLMFRLLENVLDEIARNGFPKIILLNAHGGNSHFLNYFIQSTLQRQRDPQYAVYGINLMADGPELARRKQAILGSDDLGDHAGNYETALMMALRPELVAMDRVAREESGSRGRLDHFKDPATGLKNIYTGIWWYADHPTHFAGDPAAASAEKGNALLELLVEETAQKISIIKEDGVTQELLREFFEQSR
jgi:creatinine amidohydrolase